MRLFLESANPAFIKEASEALLGAGLAPVDFLGVITTPQLIEKEGAESLFDWLCLISDISLAIKHTSRINCDSEIQVNYPKLKDNSFSRVRQFDELFRKVHNHMVVGIHNHNWQNDIRHIKLKCALVGISDATAGIAAATTLRMRYLRIDPYVMEDAGIYNASDHIRSLCRVVQRQRKVIVNGVPSADEAIRVSQMRAYPSITEKAFRECDDISKLVKESMYEQKYEGSIPDTEEITLKLYKDYVEESNRIGAQAFTDYLKLCRDRDVNE